MREKPEDVFAFAAARLREQKSNYREGETLNKSPSKHPAQCHKKQTAKAAKKNSGEDPLRSTKASEPEAAMSLPTQSEQLPSVDKVDSVFKNDDLHAELIGGGGDTEGNMEAFTEEDIDAVEMANPDLVAEMLSGEDVIGEASKAVTSGFINEVINDSAKKASIQIQDRAQDFVEGVLVIGEENAKSIPEKTIAPA